MLTLFSKVWKLSFSLFEKTASMKKNFGAERLPQKTAQASESAVLQPVKEFLLRDQLFTAQTQKTNTSLLHFQKTVHQMNFWTRGMQISNTAEVFCVKLGDFLPKMREQFWKYRVLNGLKLFRSKSEKFLRKKILP